MRTMQRQIIKELGVKPSIDPEAEFQRRCEFLAMQLGKSGSKGFILGISGGQDSLLAGLLAKRATEISTASGHPAEFYAALLPYRAQADRNDALAALDIIKPDRTYDFNIGASTDSFAKSFAETAGEPLLDFHKGNAKARVRMMAQYAFAGQYSLLVVGTDHAAEAITGFYTKYGDGAADVIPLDGLNKRQGRQMLQYLGAPSLFTEKAPTADLLDGIPSQPDETELGISYDTIDDYLEGKDIDQEPAKKLEQHYIKTRHKRRMPVSCNE